VQSFRAVAVICAILIGFAQAPFLHVHEHDFGEEHHATEQAHVHERLSSIETDGPSIQEIDPADDERTVDWLQAVSTCVLSLYLTSERIEIPEPAANPGVIRPVPIARGNSPPCCAQLPGRSPPSDPA
jgi:hypothetical protein